MQPVFSAELLNRSTRRLSGYVPSEKGFATFLSAFPGEEGSAEFVARFLEEVGMTKVKVGDRVRIHYRGALEDGTVFGTSLGGEPLEFTVGSEETIPGLERAVVGMEEGDTKEVEIPPEEGFGEAREDLIAEVDRDDMPEDLKPEVGMRLNLQTADGRSLIVRVTKVTDDKVTLDANHPLAGKTLYFTITLLEIL